MKTAKDIMTSKMIFANEEDSIAKVISKMERYDIKEVPIVSDHKILGMVTYYDILDYPRLDTTEKITTLKFMPPMIEKDTPIEDIARLMLQTGVEAIPVVENGKVIGLVSDYDLIKEFRNYPQIKKLRIKDVYRTGITLLKKNDMVSEARRIMRFNNWDRLAVADENGINLGLVISTDILRTFYRSPKQKIGRQDIGGQTIHALSIPVTAIMRKNVPEVYLEDNVVDVLNKLLAGRLKGIQVLDRDKKVVGLFMRKDILGNAIERRFEKGVWMNFSGDQLSFDEIEALKDYLASDIKKLKMRAPDMASLDVHIKKMHFASENKWNYEVNVALVKENGEKEVVTNPRGRYGYNLMYLLQEAIKRMDKKLERNYKKRGGKQYYA